MQERWRMNERIRELKEQATRTAMWPGDPDAGELDVEKFAELIIQDCVDILSGYHGKVIWKNEETGHNHPIFVIQNHFGVEL